MSGRRLDICLLSHSYSGLLRSFCRARVDFVMVNFGSGVPGGVWSGSWCACFWPLGVVCLGGFGLFGGCVAVWRLGGMPVSVPCGPGPGWRRRAAGSGRDFRPRCPGVTRPLSNRGPHRSWAFL